MIHAAAPCPVDVKRQMLAWWGPVIYEYYAASEGGGTLMTPEEWLRYPGTVGRAWPGSVIISGGVNIYPAEVESVLLTHPKVGDAAVFGIPDPDWGEQVKAVIEPAPDVAAGPAVAADVLAFCVERLAKYKCPKSVDFVDAMPRDPNGKLYKRKLRDPYWAGRDRAI